jgi:hypothetical protein
LLQTRGCSYALEGDGLLIIYNLGRLLPQQIYFYDDTANTVQDYEKACDAFLDGLKMDPANAEMENALRYLSNPLLCLSFVLIMVLV